MEMDASTDDGSGSSSDDGRGQSEGSADELLAAVIGAQSLFLTRRHRRNAAQRARRRHFVGSVAGRRARRPRDFDQGMRGIMRDYFDVDGQLPVYGEETFERRFRVPRSVFLRIYEAIRDRPFWRQSIHATRRPQAYALQKLVAAFRVLAYGESYDRADEYVRLSKSTIEVATKKLIEFIVEFIVEEWEPVYLRALNDEEVKRMLERNAARGMPGCIGSLDCSHWEWAACPKGLAGQYQNRKKQRYIVMETVCDEDLYIWHFFIGAPVSLNDLNVLRNSPLYFDVVEGVWPPKSFSFCVNGRSCRLLYYLTDGVFPKYPFFVSPYPNPITPAEKSFNRLQEALRKDFERLYGVLTARFHILLHPGRFGSVEHMMLAGKAAAILHNMVVEQRRCGANTPRTDSCLHAVHVSFPAEENLVSLADGARSFRRRGASLSSSDETAHLGAVPRTWGPNGGTSRSAVLNRSSRNGSACRRGRGVPFGSRPRAGDDKVHGKSNAGKQGRTHRCWHGGAQPLGHVGGREGASRQRVPAQV